MAENYQKKELLSLMAQPDNKCEHANPTSPTPSIPHDRLTHHLRPSVHQLVSTVVLLALNGRPSVMGPMSASNAPELIEVSPF